MHIIDDGQHSLRATTNKAMPLPTALPAFFPSRGFTSVHPYVIIMGYSPGDVGEATEGL